MTVIFFSDSPTTNIYTLSLHDALPISDDVRRPAVGRETTVGGIAAACGVPADPGGRCGGPRSEEHTSELQSRGHLVCRLLPEKKKEMLETYNREDVELSHPG